MHFRLPLPPGLTRVLLPRRVRTNKSTITGAGILRQSLELESKFPSATSVLIDPSQVCLLHMGPAKSDPREKYYVGTSHFVF